MLPLSYLNALLLFDLADVAIARRALQVQHQLGEEEGLAREQILSDEASWTGYPLPYVDYITGCSSNSDCYMDATRLACHCDGYNCLDEGVRHPDPKHTSIWKGANQFCAKNPTFFSTDACICNQAAVMRAERNVQYRHELLEKKQAEQTPAQILQAEETKLQQKWQRMKDARQLEGNLPQPYFSTLSSTDRILSVYQVCSPLDHVPIVTAYHCGVIFQTATDTYYSEYSSGSIGSTYDGLPGSVRARRCGDGKPLDKAGLASQMWRQGHAPMVKTLSTFEVFASKQGLSWRNVSPFHVAKWMIDYQMKFPLYSLTVRNCQHYAALLYAEISGVPFRASRDLIDYGKLIGLGVVQNIIPGAAGILQGIGS